MLHDIFPPGTHCEPDAPAQFLEAAQNFALSVGLDVDMVTQGRAMQLNGMDFWLRHHGDSDPTAMVLMVEVGTLPAGDEEHACRRLLELHYHRSCASDGTYCLLPGSTTVACCLRLDLASGVDPAHTILDFVDKMATLKEQAVLTLAGSQERPFIQGK